MTMLEPCDEPPAALPGTKRYLFVYHLPHGKVDVAAFLMGDGHEVLDVVKTNPFTLVRYDNNEKELSKSFRDFLAKHLSSLYRFTLFNEVMIDIVKRPAVYHLASIVDVHGRSSNKANLDDVIMRLPSSILGRIDGMESSVLYSVFDEFTMLYISATTMSDGTVRIGRQGDVIIDATDPGSVAFISALVDNIKHSVGA